VGTPNIFIRLSLENFDLSPFFLQLDPVDFLDLQGHVLSECLATIAGRPFRLLYGSDPSDRLRSRKFSHWRTVCSSPVATGAVSRMMPLLASRGNPSRRS